MVCDTTIVQPLKNNLKMKKVMMMAALVAGMLCFSTQVSAQERVQTNTKVKKPTDADRVTTGEMKKFDGTVAPARTVTPARTATPAQRPDRRRVQRPEGQVRRMEAPAQKKMEAPTQKKMEAPTQKVAIPAKPLE